MVELGVERHHSAIRLFQLAPDLLQLLVAGPQLADRAQQLAVGLPDLVLGRRERRAREMLGDLRRLGGEGRRIRQLLREQHLGPAPRRRLDDEPIHQAAGADDAQAHSGGRLVLAGEDLVEIADARSLVDRPDEQRRPRAVLEQELAAAPAGVSHRVAADLRGRGGDARLVLGAEAEQGGDLARTLARDHHVALGGKLDGRERQEGLVHGSLITTTVESSPLRRKSR